MSDAADRRIAELEQRVKELGWENANLRKACDMERKISKELHALVERLVTLGNEMAATEAASGSVEAARKWRELVRGALREDERRERPDPT